MIKFCIAILYDWGEQAWASRTLAWLHCARVCLSMDRPLTANFKSGHLNISRWVSVHTSLTCIAKPWERAWRATQGTARLQGRCEREWEQRLFKLNALAAHMTTYSLNYGTSLTIVWQGRVQVTVGQLDVRWLQVRAWHGPLIYSMNFPARLMSWFDCEA